MKLAGFVMALAMFAFALLAEPVRAVMPDPAVTPGATNPAVVQANIARTVCKAGWTKTIRPPASYTNKLKRTQLASGPYASNAKPGAFEEDHLISLELGGHPTDPRNLWPEPYKPKDGMGARVKDQVEGYLKREVCAGRSTLEEAQAAILEWEATYHERLEGRRK
jgi:hypothetical protein